VLTLYFYFPRWLKIFLAVDSAGRRSALLILLFAGPLCFFPGTAHPQTKSSSTNFAALSKRAAEARDADRLEEAVTLYTRAVALEPKWEEGWWSLGTLEYDQDHYAKAALAFEKVIALNPAHGTAHAMLGLCQFELGKDEPALKNLRAAERFGIVKDEQLRKVALYHLGVLQLRARKYRESHDTLQQLAKDGVRTKELIMALGQAALLIRPQDSPPEGTEGATMIERTGEAETLLATKEFDRAKQIYALLVSQFPNYPNLHFAYGRLLLETHETDEAIQEFQRELNRDPKNVNSLLEIAAVRYQVDSQDGLKYAEEAVKLAPGLAFAHYLLGLLRLDTGNAAGAIPEFEIAQKAFPREAQVYFSLGNAYARAGRKTEAAKARAEFLRLNAQAARQPGSNVYGEGPSGVSEQQLRSVDREKPPL
jgi:tetratricopeptide (TPR) repeat protein